MIICQSCGMNIDDNKVKGTNKGGSLSKDFCSFCFKDGEYTNNVTLDEKVEICLNHSPEYQSATTDEEKRKLKQQTKDYLSNLKRWNCTCTNDCASGYNPNCTCTSSECHCTVR